MLHPAEIQRARSARRRIAVCFGGGRDGRPSGILVRDGNQPEAWVDLAGASRSAAITCASSVRADIGSSDSIICTDNGKAACAWLSANVVEPAGVVADLGVMRWLLCLRDCESDLRSMADAVGIKASLRGSHDACEVCILVFDALSARLDSAGMADVFWGVEAPLTRIVAGMEVAGVGLDLDRMREIRTSAVDMKADAERRAFAIAGRTFKVDDNGAVSDLLFRDMGLPPPPDTKPDADGTYPVRKGDVLLGWLSGNPIAKAIADWKDADWIAHRVVDDLLKHADVSDWRVRPEWRQAGSVCGRFSCAKPPLHSILSGKSRVKSAVVAAPGCLLVCADFGQLQFRTAADRCLAWFGRSRAADTYLSGDADIHAETARALVAPRRSGKKVNFSLLFGMTEENFVSSGEFPEPESRKFWRGFHSTYPEFEKAAALCLEKACMTGEIRSPSGRRRVFPRLRGKNPRSRWLMHEGWTAWNTVNQMIEADIARAAMVSVDAMMRAKARESAAWEGARIVAQHHDSIVIEASEDVAAEIPSLLREACSRPSWMTVPIVVNVGVPSRSLEEALP